MSGESVARICRAEVRRVDLVQLAGLFGAVGMDLAARAYPVGDAIRDRPQLAVLERFRMRLPAGASFRYEVPVITRPTAGPGERVDQRAWDAVLDVDGGTVAIEVETRVSDIQALLRRLELKRRDGAVDRLVIVLGDTANNRRVLRDLPQPLATQFPGSARNVLVRLRAGRLPDADAILLA